VLVCTSTGAFALGAAAWGVLTDFVPDFTGGTAAPRIGMLPAGSWNSRSSIDDEHAAAAQLPTPVPLNQGFKSLAKMFSGRAAATAFSGL